MFATVYMYCIHAICTWQFANNNYFEVVCVCALASAKWELSDQLNTRIQQQRKRAKRNEAKKNMIQK